VKVDPKNGHKEIQGLRGSEWVDLRA